LVRASDGCVQFVADVQTVLAVVFCEFQLSLVITVLKEPAKVFVPDGKDRRLVDLPLEQERMKTNADDPQITDWVVGLRWKKALPRDQARRFPRIFANPNIVCKLRDPRTVDFLKREFGVTD